MVEGPVARLFEHLLAIYGFIIGNQYYNELRLNRSVLRLAYGGNYNKTGKTGLHTCKCEQINAIECGDDYGEFMVTKASSVISQSPLFTDHIQADRSHS